MRDGERKIGGGRTGRLSKLIVIGSVSGRIRLENSECCTPVLDSDYAVLQLVSRGTFNAAPLPEWYAVVACLSAAISQA